MKVVYLIAAILGAIIPYLFYFNYIASNGVDVPGFVSALFSNAASGGFTVDLLLSSFVFWAFMWHRNRYAHGPSPFGFVALNLLIGLSCALPAYLYAMEVKRRPENRKL